VVDVSEYAEGLVAKGEGWTCSAREVKHAQPYLECFGLRFETDEGVVAFSGDTAPTESVVELARDADLFVMEAPQREAVIQRSPSRISESGTLGAGRMARQANAKRLVINHQSVALDAPEETTQAIAEVKSMYDGPVFWGRDMMDVEW
jgi:ribonuclease BN (tRNA processing enzyme)